MQYAVELLTSKVLKTIDEYSEGLSTEDIVEALKQALKAEQAILTDEKDGVKE